MNGEKELLEADYTDFCALDYPCAYLPGRSTRMLYRYSSAADISFCSSVIRRGWRRFGNYYFYPICSGCRECKSLRIDIERFRPSRSQKKAIKRNSATRMAVAAPSATKLHIELYNRYHLWKSRKDGWKYREIDIAEYYENFVAGAHEFGKEVLYFIDGRLAGVDLVDIVEDGLSAVYFYYDPDFSRYSLGTYSLIYQIEAARMMGLRYIYLGYWVDGCRAFAYKTGFAGLEILDGFPPQDEEPLWMDYGEYIAGRAMGCSS
jgi:arginine-tRNA-protein transferase